MISGRACQRSVQNQLIEIQVLQVSRDLPGSQSPQECLILSFQAISVPTICSPTICRVSGQFRISCLTFKFFRCPGIYQGRRVPKRVWFCHFLTSIIDQSNNHKPTTNEEPMLFPILANTSDTASQSALRSMAQPTQIVKAIVFCADRVPVEQ